MQQTTSQATLDFTILSPEEESIIFKYADESNIRDSLPILTDTQCDDILRIENRFKEHKGYLASNQTGTGKAQPLYSRIGTPSGFVQMGSLRIGNEVIGYDGKPKKVIGIFPQGTKKVYKVTFQDGSSTECCSEHLWETQTIRARRHQWRLDNDRFGPSKYKDPNRWKPSVKSLEEINNTIDQRHFIPIVEPVVYEKKTFIIDPYLLGVLLGDGCLRHGSYTITSDDLEIIEYCKFPKGDKITLMKSTNRTNSYKIKGSGNRLSSGAKDKSKTRKACIRLGLDGLTSLYKHIPRKYLYGDIGQRLELLQGLMDSDGTVGKGRASFCSISKKLAMGVIELVQSLGGTASLNLKKMKVYNDAYIVHMNLPSQFNPFKLKRKADKYTPAEKYLPRRAIVSVEYVGERETQCIMIDCPRQLYVTDDYILTHNTFVGLGTIKRFQMMNKRKILIIVPSDAKCGDWILEASTHFNIDMNQISDIKSIGEKDIPNVTTYANFYQNKELVRRLWDLVIYDESHYLTQNGQGKTTVYLEQHKLVANTYRGARMKAFSYVKGRPTDIDDPKFREKKKAYLNEYDKVRDSLHKTTKVLFLSATPFAYHKSLIYGDGTLWDIDEQRDPEHEKTAYNAPTRWEQFMIDNFGYRKMFNKLTIPETGVDQNLMEREFFERQSEIGSMGTRVLEVDKDYSRHFCLIDSEEAEVVNNGIKLFHTKEFEQEYTYIAKFWKRHFTYQFQNKLLECMKAKHVYKRIRQHLFLDRKVVVFHSFNNATATHPFRFIASKMLLTDEGFIEGALDAEIDKFSRNHKELWDLDLSGLKNAREAIRERFPDALEINGTISKKKRKENIKAFQSIYQKKDLIVIQSQAGREGISLHDVSGDKERVTIDLSLPVVPIEATQKEGRIYRHKVRSNAIYEYMVVGTYFEEMAFAEKIASRAKTVENLALGNLARDMETAFKEGYANANRLPPNISQGRKGKALDRMIITSTDFDRAKTYYWGRMKNKGEYKFNDYYSTPDPLGYKMVEWLHLQPNDSFLEPSAGHGAIARWANRLSENHFIEPIADLASKLALNASGRVFQHDFEGHHISNKYNKIAMNPPFGVGGKLAVEHLKKAMVHCNYHNHMPSTIIAILPNGPATNKRLAELVEDKSFRYWKISARITLPSCVFKKEGTTVQCQILQLKKHHHDEEDIIEIDLTPCSDIKEFFNKLENIEL